MPLTQSEQRAIMAADAARRAAREVAEFMVLKGYNAPSHLTRPDGMPVDYVNEKSRIPKASPNCWDRGMRGTTVGVAPGSTNPVASVHVIYADGHSEVRSAHSFKTHAARKRATTNAPAVKQNDCTAMADTIGYIGNVE